MLRADADCHPPGSTVLLGIFTFSMQPFPGIRVKTVKFEPFVLDCVLYARVSSDKQDVDLSISAQCRAIRDYAAKNELQIAREFVDEAESGRTASRPRFKEMIALAKTKHCPFDYILVWKFNRFARNRADSLTYKTLLRNKGIDVISVTEPVDDSPAGQLLEGVIESIDEIYSANLGQDIKRGMRENASRGFFNGSRPPDGLRRVPVSDGSRTRYRIEHDTDNPLRLNLIRRMFQMSFKGIGCKEIAKTLNREGFRTSVGKPWSRTTVHKVLTNEAYCGTLVWGGRRGHPAARSGEPPVRVETAWPPIIERDIFDEVQKKMSLQKPSVVHPRSVPSPYALTGFIFCACGAAITGHSAKSGKYFYYVCSRSYKQGKDFCHARMLPKAKLERLVIDRLRARVLTDENLEKLVVMVNEELQSASGILKERIDAINAELIDVTNRLSKHYDALETGKLELDQLAPRIKQLRDRQDELNKSREMAELEIACDGTRQVDASIVKDYAEDLRELLLEADYTERKGFLRSFIKRIEVDSDKVTISYKLPLPRTSNTGTSEVLPIEPFGGAGGIRTLYLLTASQTLSQLSYSPDTYPTSNLAKITGLCKHSSDQSL